MAIEILPEDVNKEVMKLKETKENTIRCHIKVEDGGIVKITIPPRQVPYQQDTNMYLPEEILTFSKKEIKELLQDLYVN